MNVLKFKQKKNKFNPADAYTDLLDDMRLAYENSEGYEESQKRLRTYLDKQYEINRMYHGNILQKVYYGLKHAYKSRKRMDNLDK